MADRGKKSIQYELDRTARRLLGVVVTRLPAGWLLPQSGNRRRRRSRRRANSTRKRNNDI